MNIVHTLLGPSTFWIWRNVIEIFIFSFLFYKTSLFLKRDKTKNLLPYFYGYCSIAFISYFLQLPTLNYALLIFAPAALCLFIIFHQDTLQRNFVAMKNLAPQNNAFSDSLEVLMRCMLIALNNKQEVQVLIEHHDKLDEFLDCSFKINSPLNYDLLLLLLESPSFDPKKMIWVTNTGIIRGINATWQDTLTAKSAVGATQLLSARELAQWYSCKIDCLVFELDPVARHFAVTAHGTTNPQVTSHHVLQILKKHSLNSAVHQKSNHGEIHASSFAKATADRQPTKGTIHDQN